MKCGTVIAILNNSSCGTFCCDTEMVELKANEVDAAVEKHVPVVEVIGSNVLVKVGEVEHPMGEDHYIEWIIIETGKGFQLINLEPGEKPEARFVLNEDENLVRAYAYCNLHGLWKKEL
jgi:superoxide reductase